MNVSGCPERNALLKCGFLHEMIGSWGWALKTARNHFLKALNLSKNLHRGRQRWDTTSPPCAHSHLNTRQSAWGGWRLKEETPVKGFIKRFLLWTHHTHTHTQQSHLVSRVCWLLSIVLCVLTAPQTPKSAITCSSPIKQHLFIKGTLSSPTSKVWIFVGFLDTTAAFTSTEHGS